MWYYLVPFIFEPTAWFSGSAAATLNSPFELNERAAASAIFRAFPLAFCVFHFVTCVPVFHLIVTDRPISGYSGKMISNFDCTDNQASSK